MTQNLSDDGIGWVVKGTEGLKLTMVKGHWGSSEHSVKEGEIHFVHLQYDDLIVSADLLLGFRRQVCMQ